MAIKGLTDRAQGAPLDLSPRGRPVVLGRLQKGERTGFGRDIKLYDRDYFVFVPYGDRAEELAALFAEAYGEKPKAIPDARIPVTIAGNFEIEDCAWLIASKHTENGSTFMARSDGEWIVQARDPADGHVRFYEKEELAHKDATRDAGRNKPGYIYGTRTYPWQQVMQIDLILPDFNRLVYEAGVAGAGVVTLTTHSTYDIATLIDEYHAILDELAGLVANPMRPGDLARAKNYLPLRNFPLKLYRSEDPVSTPNWKQGADPGERLRSTRSLLHWQIAPEFAAAMQEALDKRTQQTLAAVANLPLLQAGQRTVEQIAQEANDELLGPEPPALAPPRPETPAYAGTPPWDEVAEGEFTEEEDDGDRVEILPGDTVIGQPDLPLQEEEAPAAVEYGDDDKEAARNDLAELASKHANNVVQAVLDAVPRYGHVKAARNAVNLVAEALGMDGIPAGYPGCADDRKRLFWATVYYAERRDNLLESDEALEKVVGRFGATGLEEPATAEEAEAQLDEALGRTPEQPAWQDALEAATVDEWAQAAWKMPDVEKCVRGLDGLKKWVDHVTNGKYTPEVNEDLLAGLRYYVEKVEKGTAKLHAANEVRQAMAL